MHTNDNYGIFAITQERTLKEAKDRRGITMGKTQLERVLDKFEMKLKKSARIDYSTKELAAAGCILDIGEGIDIFARGMSLLMREKISDYLTADDYTRAKGIVISQPELKVLLEHVFRIDKEQGDEEYYCVKEVAAMLGVTEITVRRWLRSGAIGSTQIGGPGGKILIPKSETKLMWHRPGENFAYDKGFVYIVKSREHYKIGYSVRPIKRFVSMRTGNPDDTELIGLACAADYIHLESILHEKFKEKRVRGEWFTLSEEDLAEIAKAYNFWTLDQIHEHGADLFVSGAPVPA
jgi:excisionase family DNA binding protein